MLASCLYGGILTAVASIGGGRGGGGRGGALNE